MPGQLRLGESAAPMLRVQWKTVSEDDFDAAVEGMRLHAYHYPMGEHPGWQAAVYFRPKGGKQEFEWDGVGFDGAEAAKRRAEAIATAALAMIRGAA